MHCELPVCYARNEHVVNFSTRPRILQAFEGLNSSVPIPTHMQVACSRLGHVQVDACCYDCQSQNMFAEIVPSSVVNPSILHPWPNQKGGSMDRLNPIGRSNLHKLLSITQRIGGNETTTSVFCKCAHLSQIHRFALTSMLPLIACVAIYTSDEFVLEHLTWSSINYKHLDWKKRNGRRIYA